MPQAHLAQARQLHEQLLAQRIEVQARLERGDVRGPRPVVGRAQALPGGHRVTLGLGETGPLGTVVGEQGLELVPGRRLPGGRRRELPGHDVALVAGRPLAIRQRREGTFGLRDPTLSERDGGLGPCPASLDLAAGTLVRRDIAGEAVTPLAELGHAGLPGGDRLRLARGGPACRGIRGGAGLHRREGGGCALRLEREPLGLRGVPRRLPRRGLELPARGTLDVLGAAPRRGRRGLGDPGRVEPRTRVGRRGRRRLRRLLGGVGLGLEGLHLARQPIRLCPPLEGRVAAPDAHRERIDHRAPVTGHGEPADGQDGLHLEGRGQVRRPDGTAQQRAHGSVGIPTHGLGQASAGHGRQRVIEPAQLAGRSATGNPVGCRQALAHDHVAALAREGGRPSPLHDVGAGEVPQGRLHGRTERRLDPQVLVHPPAAELPRGAGDPATLLLVEAAGELLQAPACPGEHRPGPGRSFGHGATGALRGVRRGACRLARRDRRRLLLRRRLERRACLGQGGIQRRAPALGLDGARPLVGHPSPCVRVTPAGRLGLPRARSLGASQRSELVAPGPRRRAQRAELGQRLGQGPVRVAQRGLQLGVPLGHRLRQDAPLHRHVRVGGRALVRDPLPIPNRRGDLARRPRLAQPQGRELGSRGFVHQPALALQLRALGHRGRDAGHRRFRGLECLERPLRLQAQGIPAPLRVGRATGGFVPPPVSRGDQRRRQLLAGREAGRLLLGELAEAPRLRAELREDVLDAREVRLGLGELVLRLPAPPLVAADPGDLLEQRPALLGAQREGLVHHALPDEQERVLGDVRRVQQVLEVAQADALPVEQVVVLAGPVEAPAELHDGVLDREQRVAVLEDEGHVGHALGAAPLGAGPDHVLALADPQGAALLAQRPPQGVGQVGLPRPVGTDDRADARARTRRGSARRRT